MVFDHPIDQPRPIKVICIGAGVSGIITAIRFPQKIQNLNLVVYEKNADLGGTWLENTCVATRLYLVAKLIRIRYPGVRCDIPSAGYQLTFENNSQWSEFYASGHEIQKYLVDTAKKYDVYKYCKFQHLFKSATWKEDVGKWEVVLENLTTGKVSCKVQ
jgi:cation diffusion facilitator CzcD-associated flavoprotein CzcO